MFEEDLIPGYRGKLMYNQSLLDKIENKARKKLISIMNYNDSKVERFQIPYKENSFISFQVKHSWLGPSRITTCYILSYQKDLITVKSSKDVLEFSKEDGIDLYKRLYTIHVSEVAAQKEELISDLFD